MRSRHFPEEVDESGVVIGLAPEYLSQVEGEFPASFGERPRAEGRTGLNDCLVKQILGVLGEGEELHCRSPRALTEDCHVARVPAELADVLLDPLERQDDILEPVVTRVVLSSEAEKT